MSENIALLGADPELFVNGTTLDHRGRPQRYEMIPAFGKFGGNKEKPLKMAGMDEGYMYLEDNAALEFNIPPQKTARDFVDSIATAKNWMVEHLLNPQQLSYSESNVLELTPKYQQDPRGKEVGCLADHDAYRDGAKRDPFNAETLGNYRYAGGHFHIAYNVGVVPAYVAARFLDLYLCLPWLDYDRQGARRPVYGKAGLFRPKSYGVEYRTLSNFWLWHGDGAQMQLAESALTFARRSYEPEYLSLLSEAFVGIPWNDVQACITNEDTNMAAQLIELADRTYSLGVRQRPRRR
jgi:hypothetical protein